MRIKYPIRVAIHGVPRSGTTWLGEILNSSPNTLYKYQPLFSYVLKDFLTQFSEQKDIDVFFDLLTSTNNDFLDQVQKRHSGILPIFAKEIMSHVVYKEVRYHNILNNLMYQDKYLFLVLIIRSPFAVINSWLKAPREFRFDLEWDILEEWHHAHKKNMNKLENYFGYEKWKEATYLFLNLKKKYPERVYIVEYKDLLKDTVSEVKSLFDFCQLQLTEQTRDFIIQSRSTTNIDHYSTYRVKQTDKDWCRELHQKIITEITNDLRNTELEVFVINDYQVQ